MHTLIIAEHPQFGKVRTIENERKMWFCAADVAQALGYVNSNDAQGAPLIAAIWGVFIWKEFKGSTKSVNQLLALMFIFFLVGLGMIVVAGN